MKRKFCSSVGLDDATEKSVDKELKLGFMNLGEGFFEQAESNFKLALALDPKAPDAYWGLMLCKLGATSEDDLQNSPMKNKTATSLEECQKAIEFADEDLKKKYESLLENVRKVNLGDEY